MIIDRESLLYRACKTDERYLEAKADIARRKREQAAHTRQVMGEYDRRDLPPPPAPRNEAVPEIRRLIRLLEWLLAKHAKDELALPTLDRTLDLERLQALARGSRDSLKTILAPIILDIIEEWEAD